jgi:hypothetical protein
MVAGSSELRTHVGIPNCSKNSFNLNEKHFILFPKRCKQKHNQQDPNHDSEFITRFLQRHKANNQFNKYLQINHMHQNRLIYTTNQTFD